MLWKHIRQTIGNCYTSYLEDSKFWVIWNTTFSQSETFRSMNGSVEVVSFSSVNTISHHIVTGSYIRQAVFHCEARAGSYIRIIIFYRRWKSTCCCLLLRTLKVYRLVLIINWITTMNFPNPSASSDLSLAASCFSCSRTKSSRLAFISSRVTKPL